MAEAKVSRKTSGNTNMPGVLVRYRQYTSRKPIMMTKASSDSE